ncbi:FadR/GntR family transcriptional regulator [Salinactinospora qingdaonensis]|uniref:FadR/GntR family transcriptional regulator n=1 Tax=Salinactinospora qingdaonensis TaxID=702744 RepID=A0ABP7GC17_9ACTN
MIIAQRIVADMKAQGLTAGDKLPSERAMLEEYSVGRGTLREALRYLELQGTLTLKPGPGGGPVVASPDASHLAANLMLLLQFAQAPYRVIMEARNALEPVMATLAAERMDADDLARLGETVTNMRDNLADRATFLAANKGFHDIIAWSSGNALFGYLVDAILGMLDGTVLGIDYPLHRRGAILEAHEKVYQALSSQDPTLAGEAMRDHIMEYTRYAEVKYPELLTQEVSWDQVLA